MAALTPNQVKSFWAVKDLGPTILCYEKGSASFKAGDLVIVDSNGLIDIAAASGSNIDNSVTIVGIALADATGVANTPAKVGTIGAQTRLFMPVLHSTPASAVTAITNINETFVIKNDATYGWGLLLSTTTNACAKMMGIYPEFPVGTQYGIVEVAIPASIDSDVTYSRLQG